jgi:hypothetical protein
VAKLSATSLTAESAVASTNTEAGCPERMSGKLPARLLEQTDAGVSQASALGETVAAHSATTAKRPDRMKSPALYKNAPISCRV